MSAYLDGRTFIHTLDPRTKIAWSVVVSVLAILLRTPQLLAGLIILTVLPWLLVRPPLTRVRILLGLVAAASAGSLLSQGFFYTIEPRTLWVTVLPGLSLSREGVLHGAIVSLRLMAVLSAGSLVVVTTHPADLILALTKLRVPHWFAFMLTLALRFLPETVEQGRRILVAQQLRGVPSKGLLSISRRFRLLIVPLLSASLRSARQIAMAVELRAYSPDRVPAGLAIVPNRLDRAGRPGSDGRDRSRDRDMATRCLERRRWMMNWLYSGSVLVLLMLIGVAVLIGVRRHVFRTLTTLELATLAMMICLLHVAVVPWQIAFAKVPGLDRWCSPSRIQPCSCSACDWFQNQARPW